MRGIIMFAPKRHTIAVAIAATLTSFTTLTFAQQTSPPLATTLAKDAAKKKEGDVEVVVVTAQKRLQIAQEVPLAVGVLDGKQIERSGATALRDVVSAIPSLYFAQTQSPVQSSVFIRGVGSNGGVAGLEPSVGIYMDGVYLDRTSMGIGDFNDIERIEVLRGPQGTLFGKNNPAGLINFITKRPKYEPGGEITATAGNYGLTQVAATATGGFADNKLAVRASIFDRQRDGYLFNSVRNERTNDVKSNGIRLKILWEPTDNVDITTTIERGVTKQNCCAAEFGPIGAGHGAIAGAIGRPFPAGSNPNDRVVAIDGSNAYEHTIDGVSIEANWRIGKHTLTSILSKRSYDQTSQH
jgi:iron complex outermembrane recepter protein